MPRDGVPSGWPSWPTRRRLARSAGLATLALVWLWLLLALLGAGPRAARAQPLASPGATPSVTSNPAPSATPATPTPTNTPATPTATPSSTAAPTATAAAPTPTSSSGGSTPPTPTIGGTAPAQPTVVGLGQPTVGNSSGGDTSAASSSTGSLGLILTTSLGCIVGLIGLMAMGITAVLLVTGGWGPVLQAIILGNRKGRRRFGRKPAPGPEDAYADESAAVPARRMAGAPNTRGQWR